MPSPVFPLIIILLLVISNAYPSTEETFISLSICKKIPSLFGESPFLRSILSSKSPHSLFIIFKRSLIFSFPIIEFIDEIFKD